MIGPLFAWFNVFAFAACMSGPESQADRIGGRLRDPSISILYADQGGPIVNVDLWTLGDTPVRVCVDGVCADYPHAETGQQALCRAAFDLDGDRAVTLRDLAELANSVVWCDAGKCLRMVG